ncbi:hypothetical protein [Algoriphagus pacificus]|uniref:STAS domain-containing protein n=1 Tax=Algoriphagus pacificus TaxID=2811234 RepID=A0ABS3CKZ8_9BACT|nr:hypothetical protein [Algoriphagus pacificus]MBN7817783.1 hypothetical protein [Algoriphagus pacificus]
MSVIISVPSRLTYFNIQKVIFNIESLTDHEIVFDLSKLNYVDPEGLNYIALMPFYLQKILLKKIKIRLPEIEESISYLHFTGLLDTYFRNFEVQYYNCVEDVMFLKKTFNRSGWQKAKIGIITPNTFQSFLANELANVERLISSSNISSTFCFCFYELVRNIFDHSGETIGGFSFHYKTNGQKSLSLSIADIGRGIRNTMSEVLDFNDSIDDHMFIQEAIKPGVSGTGIIGRGLGLAKIVEIIDQVQITSGKGQIKTFEGRVKQSEVLNYSLKGTSIFLKIQF